MHQPNDVQFSTAQLAIGVTLHYAEGGDPTVKPSSSSTDSWFSSSRVLPLLSPEYHAFGLTERGHGDSGKPECCYTLGDFAAAVDAFMGEQDAVFSREDPERLAAAISNAALKV